MVALDLFPIGVQNRESEPLFCREVIVEGSLGHAGCGRNVLHAGRMKALAADEISAGSNQAGMGLWIRWSCHEIIYDQSLYQRQAGF